MPATMNQVSVIMFCNSSKYDVGYIIITFSRAWITCLRAVSAVTEMDHMFEDAKSFKQTVFGPAWLQLRASKHMFEGSIYRGWCGPPP